MVYGSASTVVKVRKTVIAIGGTALAEGSTLSFVWGNKVNGESIIGTDVPEQWTGPLAGVAVITFPYITDLNLASLVDPGSDGMVPETTITEALTDTQSTPKTDTWTFKARLEEAELYADKDGFVRARLRGPITSRPTRVQT